MHTVCGIFANRIGWFAPALAVLVGCLSLRARADVPVIYQLPAPGKLPATYLVTLAIVDAKNPDWIVSTFVAGEPRTVTVENGGKFTEKWDGLDENFMPVPPGEYGVKGIYAPASLWPVDGEYHAIVPKWAGGASPWLPSAEQWQSGAPFSGDPVNSPMRDVAVGPNGVAVFYYQYLENGRQCPMLDLNKPLGADQFLRSFPSGGAGGGTCVATDGETVWAYCAESGPKYIYRADGKSFGSSPNANRRNSYQPDGWVADMAALRSGEKSYVYLAQRGKMVSETNARDQVVYRESPTEFVNLLTVHDGSNGKLLAQIPINSPQSLDTSGNCLYCLHKNGNGWRLSRVELKEGLPSGEWQKIFDVPSSINPNDMTVDSRGRFYLSDSAANKGFQLDAAAKITRTYGRLAQQQPGSYDRETLMQPARIAAWTDAQGQDRLIVVEMAGPNRVSEWSCDSGALLREFMSYQTKANNGYAIDPADASLIYFPGQGDWLTRFKVDYTTREWKVDAVWPDVESGQRQGLDKPVAIRVKNNLYLASEQNFTVYRLDAKQNRWLQSAGLVRRDKDAFFWNDANGNGQADKEEMRSTTLPGQVLTYHGQKWLADLSYLGIGQGGKDVWRAAPSGYDAHDNPIFNSWQKVVTDPIFQARSEGKADAVHGGNELAETYSSDWMQADGSPLQGYYVQARGGKNFTANFGAQYKISRYVPDGTSYRLRWRVGRTTLEGKPARGEILGGMRIFKPINGLLSVIDQSRSGVFLYTEDGLFVDTLFPDESKRDVGIYRQPGEFFAGTVYPNAQNGKIYYASGKFTPFLYEVEGWSLKDNPVRALTTVQPKVTINAAQIASPPEIALSLRGGVGKTTVVRFMPALGGAELNGSLTGWEGAEPVQFSSGKDKTVEVRTLYTPDELLLRWHVWLGSAFEAKPLPPLERLFTHDQLSDTVGFYIQGDVESSAKMIAGGRPGDVRIVAGLFKSGGMVQPAAVALYPQYSGKDARPQTYRTPVGEATFAYVGAIPGIKMGGAVDIDGKGFVLAVAIPRAAIPALKIPFSAELRTMVNFDANLGGHDKFWWANSDGSASRETYDEPSEARFYPGSWAPAQFRGLDDGATVPNWLVAGPFGGPGAEKFTRDPQNKTEVSKFYETAAYPPDHGAVDMKAVYEGEQIRGYWDDPRRVTWRPAEVADMDTRVNLGYGSQVWYGSTWIYSPADTAVTLELQGHRMTTVRWFLNGDKLNVAEKEYKDAGGTSTRRMATREVTLRSGWNQVFFRAYNVGYASGSPFRLGLVIKATPDKLWPLRFAGQPPTS